MACTVSRPMVKPREVAQDGGMPQGSKAAYTDKQKRKAGHIEEGYRESGMSNSKAEARAWATVNKQDGGGKKKRAGVRKKKASSGAATKP